MRRAAVTRVALLEGLPAACLLGVLGIVINYRPLAGAFFAPVGLWTAAGALGARTLLEELEQAAGPASDRVRAVVRGFAAPVFSLVGYYRRLGLYRGRWLYDLAALGAFGCSALWWWSELGNSVDYHGSARLLGVFTLVLGGAGGWSRRKTRPFAQGHWHDVIFALEGWKHRRRRVDEFAYEDAVATHLEQLGFDVVQGQRLDSGREADIVVRPKGRSGPHDFRDVMIEMKAHLVRLNERDRALGQLETYAREWSGPIVLMVCGEYRSDLLKPLEEKAALLNRSSRPVAFVVKGRERA
jgi:hypothetical protein